MTCFIFVNASHVRYAICLRPVVRTHVHVAVTVEINGSGL